MLVPTTKREEFELEIKDWIAKKRIVIADDIGYTTNEGYERGKLTILKELEQDFELDRGG